MGVLHRDRNKATVHVVTRAHRSRSEDIEARQKRYLISMAIRTGAVLIAFFAPLPWWARGIALALGLVLPWVSVSSANAGPLPDQDMSAYDASDRQLPPGTR